MCPPLPNIANGVITYSVTGHGTLNYSLRTVATYSCNYGFVLDPTGGSETRPCVDNGDSDAEGIIDMQEPACVRKSTIIVHQCYDMVLCIASPCKLCYLPT